MKFRTQAQILYSFGGGGGGQDTSTVNTVQQLAPEQRELLGEVIPRAKAYVQNPPKLYPQSAVAGFDPAQLASQKLAVDTAGGATTAAINNTLASNAYTLNSNLLSPDSNPYLGRAAEAAIRPLTQQYENVVLPNIRTGAIGAGQYGGSRQGIAEGLASKSYLDTVGDTTAKLYSQGYGQGLDAMTKAQALAPSIIGTTILPSQVLDAVGAQRQGLQQTYNTEASDRFMAEQLLPFAAAKDVAGLAFGIGGGTAASQATTPTPRTSALGGAAGLGTLGYLIGSGTGIGGPAGAALGAVVGALFR